MGETHTTLDAESLLAEATALREGDPKRSLELTWQAVELCEERGDKEGWYEGMVGLINTYCLLGNYHEVFDLVNVAGAYKMSAGLHYGLGKAYAALGDGAQALKHFLEVRELSKDDVHSSSYLSSLSSIARLHHTHGDYELELDSYRQVLALVEQTDPFQTAMVHNNMAMAYSGLGDIAEALRHAETACQLGEAQGKRSFLATCICTVGELYLQAKEPLKALEPLERSLSMARRLGLLNLEHFCHKSIGECHLLLGDTGEALTSLTQALAVAGQTGQKLELANCYKSLAEAHKQAGDAAKALECFERYHALSTELFNAEAERSLQNVQVLHATQTAQAQAEAQKQRADELQNLVEQRTAELERSHIDVLERLLLVTNHRDGETAAHTKRVGSLAAKLAKELGFAEPFVHRLEIAARLHDLGKVGIPDAILQKPGRLTKDEFEQVKRHTVMGAGMLAGSQTELMKMAQDIALSHHEHWDGTGYPQGLKGEAIPLPGRIVAVVDTYDALIHRRPYKEAWSLAEAKREVMSQSERRFDPKVVKAFCKVLAAYDLPGVTSVSISNKPALNTRAQQIQNK